MREEWMEHFTSTALAKELFVVGSLDNHNTKACETCNSIEDELLMRTLEFRSKYNLNQEQEMPL